MPDNDKANDLLKELEIQSILDERHRIADEEKMQKTAQKYRAKAKVEEIFSNADKKPRLKNENPLEVADKQKQPDVSNTIVGEKTAATMKTELMMDGREGGETLKTPEEAEAEARAKAEKEEAERMAAELAEKQAAEAEKNKIITLTPEYDESTQFSGEVLDELEQFRESPEIESINGIDIDLKTDEPEPEQKEGTPQDKPEAEAAEKAEPEAETPAAVQPERIISKVPVYRPEEPGNILNVKAGRFSEVVAREYEEYIRSKSPSVRAHVIHTEPKEEKPKEEEQDNRTTQEKLLSAVVGFFSKDESDDVDTPKKNTKPVEDYTSEDDEESIKFELNENIRKLFFRSIISGAMALVAVILAFVTRIFPDSIISAIPVAPAAYAVFNLLLIGSAVVLNRVAMLNGFTPLMKLKGNSDTAVAVAGGAAVIQTIVSFFCLGDMSGFNVNYYCVIVLLAFFANNLGKLMMVMRVKDNFRFLSAKGQKYAAKIYNNESVANKMLSGTPSDKSLIAYQHKTKFASNFLKISYAPDPSEDLASKLAPITIIATLVITVLYGIVKSSFTDAVNTMALLTTLSIPVSTLLAVNMPVRRLCKTLIGYGAMMSGYPSIKQFCDSTAIMIDAGELFPADSIDLEGIKTFVDYNVDESLLCGIAILKEAQNPIANAFDSVVS